MSILLLLSYCVPGSDSVLSFACTFQQPCSVHSTRIAFTVWSRVHPCMMHISTSHAGRFWWFTFQLGRTWLSVCSLEAVKRGRCITHTGVLLHIISRHISVWMYVLPYQLRRGCCRATFYISCRLSTRHTPHAFRIEYSARAARLTERWGLL